MWASLPAKANAPAILDRLAVSPDDAAEVMACGVPARGSVVSGGIAGPTALGSGRCAMVRVAGDTSPVRAERSHAKRSSSAVVFVDQASQHVDSLHRRFDGARLDQRQPGGRTRRAQIKAAVWSLGVVVPQILGQHAA